MTETVAVFPASTNGRHQQWSDPHRALYDNPGECSYVVINLQVLWQSFSFGQVVPPAAEVTSAFLRVNARRVNGDEAARYRIRCSGFAGNDSTKAMPAQPSLEFEDYDFPIVGLSEPDAYNGAEAELCIEAPQGNWAQIEINTVRLHVTYDPGFETKDLSFESTSSGSLSLAPLLVAALSVAATGDGSLLTELSRILHLSVEALGEGSQSTGQQRVSDLSASLDASGSLATQPERIVLVSADMTGHGSGAVDVQRLQDLAARMAGRGLLSVDILRVLPALRNPRVVILPAGSQLSLSPADTRLRRH